MFRVIKSNLEIKLILLVACFLNSTQGVLAIKQTVFVLLTIFLSLLLDYQASYSVKVLVASVCCAVIVFNPSYVLFLPVLLFNYLPPKKDIRIVIYPTIIFFLGVSFYGLDFQVIPNLLFTIGLTIYLQVKGINYLALKEKYRILETSSQEQQFILESQNSTLVDEQNLNLALGISDERNRIARDIHDNVGHLLSSALIQLGAIKVLNHADNLQEPLELVSQTVEEGMDNIRQSVHDLHDDSLNLKHSVQHIIDNVQNHQVTFTYTIKSALANQLKVDFLMIIRESLANCMKYSNGSSILLEVIEQPGFYRLLIQDDGTSKQIVSPNEMGIGILSMKKRVADQAGRLTVEQTNKGFQVLAIVPKKQGGD